MKINFANGLIIFSCLFILGSCENFHKTSSRTAVIEGHIDPAFTKNPVIYFYQYTDSLSLFFCEKTASDSCVLNTDGSFKIEIANWQKSGFFDLGTREMVFARNYFMEPGDELKLNFKGTELPLTLATYKQTGKYNTFLQVFNDTFYRDPVVKRNYFVVSNYMLAPDYATYIGKRRQAQLDFFNNYFRDGDINPVFKSWFEKETNFNWANDKVYFLWKKRMRQEEVPVDTSYFDFLQVVNTDDASALICPAYTRFIDLYLKELYQEEIFSLPPGKSQNLEKCALAKKFLRGTGRKIAYYHILHDEKTGMDANMPGNQTRHQAFLDSLAGMAFEATNDPAFINYSKSSLIHN